MTKYERINRAKLTDKGKSVYDKLSKATDGFKDKDAIKKNKAVLDKFYDRVKSGLPEAIKPAKTSKSKSKPKAKAKKPAYKNVNMGNFAKETSALAKKEGISYKEAQKKMSTIFKERKVKGQKKQGSDFDKMIAGLKKKVSYKGGRGITKTTLKKDAKLDALKFGKRISKGTGANQYGKAKKGSVYYEYRDNHADVKSAPPSQPYPKLAKGGTTKKSKSEKLSDKIAQKEFGKNYSELNDSAKYFVDDAYATIQAKKFGYAKGGTIFDIGDKVVDKNGEGIGVIKSYNEEYWFIKHQDREDASGLMFWIGGEDEGDRGRYYTLNEIELSDGYAKGGEVQDEEDYGVEYTCDNETCRKYYWGDYNSGYCSEDCRDESGYAKGGEVKDVDRFGITIVQDITYENQYGYDETYENTNYETRFKTEKEANDRADEIEKEDEKRVYDIYEYKIPSKVVEAWNKLRLEDEDFCETLDDFFEENYDDYAKGGKVDTKVSSLKKGDVITIEFNSVMSGRTTKTLKVRSRNKVRKGTIDKITFENVSNPKGMKYYAYDRGNGFSFAEGDMGISKVNIVDEYDVMGSFNEDGDIDFAKGGMTKEIENDFNMPKFLKDQIIDKDGNRKIDDKSIEMLTDYTNNVMPQTKDFYFKDGKYTKERQKLHKEIIDEFKGDLVCIEQDEPIAILMGGSPASGKSTFLRKYAPYLLDEEILRVDADETRSKLPEYDGWNASATHLETKDIVNTLLSDRTIGLPCEYDIIYDGTMNNTKAYLPLIKLLKKLGYKIYVVYVDNVPKSVIEKRVKERYQKSGRFVPPEVVDDFFSKGKTALNEIKKQVDGYMVIDGSDSNYRVIEEGGMKLPKSRKYSQIGTAIDKMATGGEVFSEQIARGYDVNLKSGTGTYAKGGKTKKMKKDDNWIQGVDKEMERKGTKGAFTKQAKKAGKSTVAFAKEVLRSPDKYSEKTRERAQFMKNVNPELFEYGGKISEAGDVDFPEKLLGYAKGGKLNNPFEDVDDLTNEMMRDIKSDVKLKSSDLSKIKDSIEANLLKFYNKGGDVPEGFHRMPDGEIMADSEHLAKGGKIYPLEPHEMKYLGYRDGEVAVNKIPKSIFNEPYFMEYVSAYVKHFYDYANESKEFYVNNYAKGGKFTSLRLSDFDEDIIENTFNEVVYNIDEAIDRNMSKHSYYKNLTPEQFDRQIKRLRGDFGEFITLNTYYAKGGNVDSFSHEIARGYDVNLKSGTGTYAKGGNVKHECGLTKDELRRLIDAYTWNMNQAKKDPELKWEYVALEGVVGDLKYYLNRKKLAKGGKTQGYNARLDESLAMRDGSGKTKRQTYKGRRDESKGEEKAMGKRAYSSVDTMDDAMLDLENFYAKGGEVNTHWLVEDGKVMRNGEKIASYDFDRDSDSFWINTGSHQTSFEEKVDIINFFKKREECYDLPFAKGGKIDWDDEYDQDIYGRWADMVFDEYYYNDDDETLIKRMGLYSFNPKGRRLVKDRDENFWEIKRLIFNELRDQEVLFEEVDKISPDSDVRNMVEIRKARKSTLKAKGGKTQGYNDRLDESLAMRRGKAKTKKQTYKGRRDESKGENKAKGERAYSSVKTMDKKVKYRGRK